MCKTFSSLPQVAIATRKTTAKWESGTGPQALQSIMKPRLSQGIAENLELRGILQVLRKRLIQEMLPLLMLTVLGFLVLGYHPGFEDDGVYLTAIKADLNPALYPHDSDFFRLQMQASVFDKGMADFVRWTAIPLAWSELLWQFAALFLILWACRRIAAQIFERASAQWAAVAMVAAVLSLPVAGTALGIADQHLHPRNLATALILWAVAWILEGRRGEGRRGKDQRWRAVPALLMALVLHPIMATLGISFSVFLSLALLKKVPVRARVAEGTAAAAIPLGWVFAPANPSWRLALASKSYYSLYRWTWYEWVGALAPLSLFWLLWRVTAERDRGALEERSQSPLRNPFEGNEPTPALSGSEFSGRERLARFSLAVFGYGVFQLVVAVALLAPQSLVRLEPFQPMRFLHLVYIFMALVGGGLLGEFLLKQHFWRWAVFLLVFNGGMFFAQWELIDEGAHLELPGITTPNPWLQAFGWIRGNTPENAYFALDPNYLAAPGEGFHGFRALAERSQLADWIKDTSVVTEVPSLAPRWRSQQLAQTGWNHFQLGDFERLKAEFGVDWVLVLYPQTAALDCRWHNGELAVCRIP
jgi:hypothetical protein